MSPDVIRHEFEKRFGHPAKGVSKAPGRVNIIGEFTDYNDGFVLPCALDFYAQTAFGLRDDKQIVVQSLEYPGEQDTFDITEDIVQGPLMWANYVRGLVFVLKRSGHLLSGMNLLISSSVPQGAGLSSSAALEVSLLGAFNQTCQLNLSNQDIALFGQQAENDFMDCQCGIMDQLISAKAETGHALLIDCQNLACRSIQMPDDLSLVIIDSNFKRKLVESEYNQRRNDCEEAASKLGVKSLREADMALLTQYKSALSDNEFKRARHVISENARVLEAADALKINDIQRLSELMAASHISLKNDFEVTVAATDGLFEICQDALKDRGAVRMTGGGFGGAVVCLCRPEDIDAVKQAVADRYYARFKLEATIYVCKAGTGLKVL